MADQLADKSKYVPAGAASMSIHKEEQATSYRKRHATDPHVLEAKISKEADRIIKLKVAQNSANWELREQVKELESIRDRQQQNLVQLQMQYETLDGDYQKELRMREDIANRVINTRSICKVLEEHFGRLTEIMSRCQIDRQTLYDTYQKVSSIIKDVRLKMAKNEEQYQTTLDNMKQKLATETERRTEMAKICAENKSGLEQLITELKKSLESSQANCITLQNENKQKRADVDDKDKLIENLRSELCSVQEKYKVESAEMKSIMFEQEKEILAKSQEIATLMTALGHQEQFSNKLAEENSQLQEKIAKVEDDGSHLIQQMEELNNTNEGLKKELENMHVQANKLVDQNNELSVLYNTQMQVNCNLKEVQQQMVETNSVQSAKIQDFEKTVENFIAEKNNSITKQETQVTEIKKVIEKQSNDLQAKSNMITTLMSDIKSGTDMRAKLEITIDKYKRDLESAKTKQSEVEKQAEMIKVAEVEMVQLKAQIKSMQEEISVITIECEAAKKSAALLMSPSPHKPKRNLSGNHSSDPDSPLMMSPVLKSQDKPATPVQEQHWVQPSCLKVSKRTSKVTFATPDSRRVSAAIRKEHSTVHQAPSRASQDHEFDLMSDSSVEGYIMDPRETDRRFEAMLAGKNITSPLQFIPIKKHGYSHTPLASRQLPIKDQIPEKGPRSLSRNIRHKGSLSNKRRFTSAPMSDFKAKQHKGE